MAVFTIRRLLIGLVLAAGFLSIPALLGGSAAAASTQNTYPINASVTPTPVPYGPYGVYTCIPGYVWREARPSDQVCVTPAVRDQARRDNAAAASRRNPNGAYGPLTCISGYVWRDAWDGDGVCVTPAVRDQAHADNAARCSRYAFSYYACGRGR